MNCRSKLIECVGTKFEFCSEKKLRFLKKNSKRKPFNEFEIFDFSLPLKRTLNLKAG